MLKLYGTIFILLFLAGCAQVVPLTGGPKDMYAPTIDSSKTKFLSETTNFNGNTIEIKFNEYIKLKNPSENIIITPQLKEKPTISVKNKTFRLKLNEQLEENTTYVINFNGAIQDITERNDSIFQYVFSTGNYIDSLSIKGRITDGFSNKPLEKILIAVYPKSDCMGVDFDSIPFIIKPTYLGQTNKQGQYIVNYLKPADYFVFAIEDKNKNLKLDVADEKIGFVPTEIHLHKNIDTINFRLFNVESDEVFITKTSFDYPGKLTVVFSKTPNQFNLWSEVELTTQNTQQNDSLIYWLPFEPNKTIQFYYQLNENPIDTISPIYHQPKQPSEKLKLSFNLKNGYLLPNENLLVSVNEPIKQIDTSKIHFFDLDSNFLSIEFHITDALSIEFLTDSTGVAYFMIDSLAFESYYGRFSTQKISKPCKNYKADEFYGSIHLTIDSLPEGNYVLHLLDKQNKVVQTKYIDDKQTTVLFNELSPGIYNLRMIKDDNNDKKWTSGSLVLRNQAEKVFYLKEQIKLRSKWTNTIVWKIES
ncbi:MAG TPA: hypothetical protein EYG85_12380 [Crocinitomix sp.]|nr:hypothetical protein [Crocinitomix sp.]